MATAALAFPRARARPHAIASWLFAVATLVFAIVVVGGITRLTESGLSMVRWEPISGIVPPFNDADWAAEFAAYRNSPQYTQVNAGMSLAAFKGIYFWEYIHRVLARVFGVALLLPLLWFAFKRAIPEGYGARLGIILALGVAQPVVGWWMVASGLVDRPAVAHERLAVHLTLALTIMAACIWTALDLREGTRKVARWVVPFLALLTVQIVWGAFTAGLRAGHAADSWPLMLGEWVPPLASLIDDPVSVQWVHRSLAYFVAAAALAIAWHERYAGGRAHALAAMVAVQFALGVATVIGGVPLAVAATHQAGAALLLAATLWLAHRKADT